MSSAEVAKWGAPTFDAWIARTDFSAKHADVVTAFVRVTGEAYAKYRADPGKWTADSLEARKIVKLTGAKPEDVPAGLAGEYFPLLDEQASKTLLGGDTVKSVAATAAFLAEQKKIPAPLADYSPYVTDRFVKAAAATN